MKKLIAMLFALALVTSSSMAFAECKPADDKKMDKKEAKAKKHKHKKEKAEKAEDKKDKM
jgi:Ni/Co efflux regulator RcnB